MVHTPANNTSDYVERLALDAILNEKHPEKVSVAQWASRELADERLIERDEHCEFWPEGWKRCADHGLQGMIVAPEYGGQGLDLITALLRFEGLGYGCEDAGLVFAVSSQVWSMQTALERFGTPEQRSAYLPGLVGGSLYGSFAISEPDSGSDAFALHTSAQREGDTYRLNGKKAWVTFGPIFDVLIVFATVNPAAGRWGITAFLVDRANPGVEVMPNKPKMGMRTTPFSDVVLRDCVVPASARLGSEGAGGSIFSTAMESERAFLLAGSVGQMERHIDQAIAYANERKQFGTPIGSFQAISHQIADMKLAHETARLLLYKAAALQMMGKPSMMAAALSKLGASESALQGAMANFRIHGAKGYVTEYGVERGVRDMAGGIIYGGSSEIQRNIVARLLGLP